MLLVLTIALGTGCGAMEPEVPSGFDGARAFQDLRDLVAIGPRPAGSEGASRARVLIAERLRQAGWEVVQQRFVAVPPQGPEIEMVNVSGRKEGLRVDERVLFMTHYDTKALPGIRFVGANDGASGVALLLEVARQLGASPPPFSVELIFFDGEEAIGSQIGPDDGLYGSRALASQMAEAGTLDSIRALILVDMVADRALNLSVDLGSAPELREILAEVAEALGRADLIDTGASLHLIDDHTPFVRRGVTQVLSVVDFQFGGPSSPGSLWHTAGDDLDAVSEASLNSVGELVVQTYRRIAIRLSERAQGGPLAQRARRAQRASGR